MFITIAVILVVAWLLGFTIFHVSVAAIHILLLLAGIAIIVHFARGTRPATQPRG